MLLWGNDPYISDIQQRTTWIEGILAWVEREATLWHVLSTSTCRRRYLHSMRTQASSFEGEKLPSCVIEVKSDGKWDASTNVYIGSWDTSRKTFFLHHPEWAKGQVLSSLECHWNKHPSWCRLVQTKVHANHGRGREGTFSFRGMAYPWAKHPAHDRCQWWRQLVSVVMIFLWVDVSGCFTTLTVIHGTSFMGSEHDHQASRWFA